MSRRPHSPFSSTLYYHADLAVVYHSFVQMKKTVHGIR